jgi:hypothetical protein
MGRMDSRDRAISELMRLMREQRARLDPRVLKEARDALHARAGISDDSVPYDRAAALKAVSLFLGAHEDRAAFEKRLAALLRQKRH